MKNCPICTSEGVVLRLSPKNHERKHNDQEKACGQCWEGYLSLQLEEDNTLSEIKCMFCTSEMSEDDFKSLAREGTKRRHDKKMKLDKGYVCMNRCDGTKTVQLYDRETNGRVFTCADCKFEVCTDCDRPEHTGESCFEYRQRLAAIHSEAENKTHSAFKSCPECDTLVELEKASCYTQCNCGYQFCSSCLVNWVGEGSAYLAGKDAHLEGCKYRLRDAESKHGLGNRWQQAGEVQHRLEVKTARKLKRKSDKIEEAAAAEEAGDATTSGQKGKDAKKAAKVKLGAT